MDKRIAGLSVFIAAVIIAVSGCAVKSPFGNSSSSARHSGAPDQQKITNTGNALGQRRPEPTQSFPQNVASAFKSAGSSVSNALAIKPRVISADDPTKLSKNPQPVDSEVFLSAARLLENRGDLEAARDQYEKALERDPKDLITLLGYARIHDRLEQFHVAENVYQRAIANHPTESITYNDLGLCLARQGKVEAAANTLTRAVRMEPDKKLYRNNLAIVMVEMGQIREAYEHLAVVHEPAVAHYNLGVFLHRQERHEEAIQQFGRALEMNPDLTAARKMLQVLGAKPSENRQSANASDGSMNMPASVHFFVGDPEYKGVASEPEPDDAAPETRAHEENNNDANKESSVVEEQPLLVSNDDTPVKSNVADEAPGLLPMETKEALDTAQLQPIRPTRLVDEGRVTQCSYEPEVQHNDNQFDTSRVPAGDN